MLRILAITVGLLIGSSVQAERIENFVLLDQHGDAHNLHYHRDKSAVVIMIQGNGCPIVRNALTDYKALRDTYADQGVHFMMLNANLQDQRSTILAEAEKFGIDMPILHDETQLIGESLNLVRTAEVLVIDPKNWQIVYRGPINDRQVYERQKAEASNHYAADAIANVLANQPVTVANRDTMGCLINFAQRNADHEQISYTDTIAPILQEKCVVCHTEGGLGPWAMSSYEMVRGFAPMMREVIRTKRMPPWHADPHIGVWKNDKSLSIEQTQILVHWIEAGAPRGEGEDPLKDLAIAQVEWPLGEPDLILDIPEYTIPASGVVDYKFPRLANPLDQGVWVKAATVIPGNREVVHHILAGSIDATTAQAKRDSGVFDNYLIGYAPGNESNLFPQDTGVYIAPGGEYTFQLHYTPIGREVVDKSRIGLYFHDKQPGNFYRQSVVIDPTIQIPPNQPRHAEVAYYEFDKPALLHDLVPHSHYRGVASKFELIGPDGGRETVLSVPNYDFNWQRTYTFVEPMRIEPGSRLVHTTWYDNSAANPGNPDPNRTVPWGLQSWDEMLYGAFSYTLVDETSEAPILDKTLADTTQMVGFLDKDMDGKLSWQELPGRIKKRLVQGFKMVDTNDDGGLDIKELYGLSKRRGQQAQSNDASTEAGGG
ncbi:MAG: redoxin family protein [Pseudomonadota bacterium]|nr:redoxin family protein [Pseudomonadota bacterium]